MTGLTITTIGAKHDSRCLMKLKQILSWVEWEFVALLSQQMSDKNRIRRRHEVEIESVPRKYPKADALEVE